MRLLLLVAAAILASCAPAPAPAPVAQPKPDPVREDWYAPAVQQLIVMNREAEILLQRGKTAEAAEIVAKAQPLSASLLTAPRPPLAAMEAVSDLDDLYGRMLLRNRHYGWARLQFQKNVVRWKNWKPQTPDTARRLKLARAAIAECDRLLAK